MAAEIITKEDLVEFEDRLLDTIKKMMGHSTDQSRKWLRSAQVRKMLNISPNTLTIATGLKQARLHFAKEKKEK